MNKFIEQLSKVGKRSVEPMGFAAKSERSETIPDLLLLATGKKLQTSANLDKVMGMADIWLEELSSLGQDTLKRNPDDLDKHVWGIKVDHIAQDQLQTVIAHGCDFIVFDSMSTAAAIFTEDKVAAVMKIRSDLKEQIIRTIGELPLDAIMLEVIETEFPLTVDSILNVQFVLGMVDLPILLEVPTNAKIESSDLELLRNIGVTGIIVEAKTVGRLANIKSMIDLLPRRKSKMGKGDAIAPTPYLEGSDHLLDPGDGHEDDDI